MLLVIDIGNTNITLGVFNDENLTVTARIATDRNKTGDQYAIELQNILKIRGVDINEIEGCIVSSVVPPLNRAFKFACKLVCNAEPIFVGPGVKSGLNIKIDNPAQLGADLVVGAVAAVNQYPMPCIILDLGTATTISVLDENSDFIGVSISAGIGISLEALTSKTSQLPQISVETPKSVIGKNTVDSMKAGLVLGAVAMIDGLIDRIEDELGQTATIVATGGLAKEIIESSKRDIILSNNLLLEGLRLIYLKNKQN